MTSDTTLAHQVEEIQLLRSSLLPDEFHWRGTQHEVEVWEAVIEKGIDEDAVTPFSFGIRLIEDNRVSLWLNVDLPRRTADGEPKVNVSVRDGVAAQSDQLELLKSKTESRLRENKEEGVEHRVFDLFTFLQDALLDEPIALHASSSSDPPMNASGSRQPSPSSPRRARKSISPDYYQLNRTILWSHHLVAPSKRRDLAAWCAELSVWGLIKLGYPGYLCFEGISTDVDEIVRRVKALQWHALKLKDEDKRSTEDGINSRDAALLSCTLSYGHSAREAAEKAAKSGAKIRTACDEVETMKEIVDRLHLARLSEEDVADVLGLRTKAANH